MPRAITFCLGLLLLQPVLAQDPLAPGGGSAPAPGAEAPAAPTPSDAGRSSRREGKRKGDWELSLQPAFALPFRTQGEATTDGLQTPLNGTLDTDLAGWALSTRVELWSPFRFGLVVGGDYAKLELDYDSRPVTPPGTNGLATETEVRLGNVDVLLGFRFFHRVKLLGLARLNLVLLAGGRYAAIRNEVRGVTGGSVPVSIGSRAHWGELVLGAEGSLAFFDEALAAIVRFDIGGYHVGSAADLDWELYVAARWRPSDRLSVELGYGVQELDVAQGSGIDKTALSLQRHGPQLTVGIHF